MDPNGPLQCCKVPIPQVKGMNKTLSSPYVQQVWDGLDVFLGGEKQGRHAKNDGAKPSPAFELFDLLSQACSILRGPAGTPSSGPLRPSYLISPVSAQQFTNLPTTPKDIHRFWLEVKNEDLPNMKMIEHAGNKPRNSFLHVANWQFDDLVKISIQPRKNPWKKNIQNLTFNFTSSYPTNSSSLQLVLRLGTFFGSHRLHTTPRCWKGSKKRPSFSLGMLAPNQLAIINHS